MKFRDALDSVESLEAFLKEAAGSPELQELRAEAEEGPHPSTELLERYVLRTGDDDTWRETAEHVALCRLCSKAAAELRERRVPPENLDEWEPGTHGLNSLEEGLQSVETLEACLLEAYHSPDFQRMRTEAERMPPLPWSTLIAYVLDTLDEDTGYDVMLRVSFDEQTEREVRWLANKKETVENLHAWADQLLSRLESLFTRLLAPPMRLELADMTAGGETDPQETRTGSPFLLSIPESSVWDFGAQVFCELLARESGYAAILLAREDDDGPLEWLFPNARYADTAIAADVPKHVGYAVRAEPGTYAVKGIWTRTRLIDPEGIDFDNRFEAKEAMFDYLQLLNELPRDAWECATRTVTVRQVET